MQIFYFTFGQIHVHSVNGFTWDKDVVCAIRAEDEGQAREQAVEAFELKWFTSHTWDKIKDSLHYYPRGIKGLNISDEDLVKELEKEGVEPLVAAAFTNIRSW